MADSQSLEDRLRSHARAFDGLMALIPAKDYYLEGTADQWKRKKQTKEEARAARMAKLDPDNNKSALDLMQENERKRKRQDEMAGVADPSSGFEKPREGMKVPKQSKKQKTDSSKPVAEASDPAPPKQSKKSRQRERKKEKKALKVAKKEQNKKASGKEIEAQADDEEDEEDDDSDEDAEEAGEAELSFLKGADLGDAATDEGTATEEATTSIPTTQKPDAATAGDNSTTSSRTSPPPFDFSAQPSGTSSISSTGTAASSAKTDKKQADSQKSEASPGSFLSKAGAGSRMTMEEMQERLRQRLAEKRAQRNAGPDGQLARTRAELLESRRKKQEQRKATKKALRKQAKEEEMRQKEEAMARGSPLMSPAIHSPPYGEENNFAFGRVAFDNAHVMTADLNASMDLTKHKGPSDVKTALIKAGNKDARIARLDPERKAQAQDKDMWLNARKRAHGEKIRDDSNLLKKALKRKQKQKDKSANDWKKRIDGVKAGKEARQKKREENLAKRKEEKGSSSKKSSKGSKAKKPKKRPGFEGSFRAGGAK